MSALRIREDISSGELRRQARRESVGRVSARLKGNRVPHQIYRYDLARAFVNERSAAHDYRPCQASLREDDGVLEGANRLESPVAPAAVVGRFFDDHELVMPRAGGRCATVVFVTAQKPLCRTTGLEQRADEPQDRVDIS